ncbi:MAG: glycosyltransferase family 4 protein [Candidatus Cloacimonetes bacterium]|nr:glycosyltransferase family 4 protein [Candidatus Cloacimonadota bacterium]
MKKKIAHIQLLPIMSGVQRISLSIFKALNPDEYECHLICAEDPFNRTDSLIERARELGITVHVIKGLKREIGLADISVFLKIFRLCKKEKFDIVHTHTSKMGVLGRIAAKTAGCKKVIHTIHGVAFHPYEKRYLQVLYYLMDMIAALFADKLVSVNNGYRKAYWYAAKKLITIYNGIPFENNLFIERKLLSPLKIIFVGRLDKQKDPMTLLKALNLVKVKGYKFEAKLVGDGELTDIAQQYIDFKGMSEDVKLLGWRDDVPELLSQSNLFILSSLYEALPLSFCEAGYSGIACIGTDIIGVREVVVNSVTGFLFPPKNYLALAELIIRFINEPKLLGFMGANAHKFITEHFNEERMIREYLELYISD